MPVRCPECGYDNRDNYRFCGMCGASLRPAPVPPRKVVGREQSTVVTETPPPAPKAPAPPPAETSPVSGPSFLGLADSPARSDVQYLLEDEESHSGGKRMLLAFLLLVIAGGLVYWRWSRDGFPWSGASSSHPAQAPVFSGAHNAPAPAQPLPPPTNETSSSAEPPVKPSSDEAHMTRSDDVPLKAENSSPVKPVENKTEQDLASVTPNPEKEPDVTPAEKADATPPPKSPPPAKPVRSAATKPVPASPQPSGDEQLVSEGEKYLYGNGVPASCDRAEKNLRTAAGHGNARALSMIGTMYATGHCLDRNLPNAYRSFARALHLEPNNDRIQRDLEVLWRQMTPEERQAATRSQ
ncbi:MAG TPA: zinc-ribbon domain-containing protein [Terriglobales bacterium]|nr:zinc-ribbon domain-containing protein [Terriglobales bacterium]